VGGGKMMGGGLMGVGEKQVLDRRIVEMGRVAGVFEVFQMFLGVS
jgi:hypothetical protein